MKKLLIVISIAFMVGCSGFDFDDNPIVNHVLLACGDVPVAEFQECARTALDGAPGSEDLTVAELIELLRTINPSEDAPVEPTE